MKYGAMNFPILPVLDEIADIADLDFDYLELAMDSPRAHYSDILEQEKMIRRVLKIHSMGLVCHLPTFVHTADLTESIRAASMDEVLNSLDVAAALGAEKVVVHPSIVSGLGRSVMDLVRGYAHEYLVALDKRARESGITLCLENMFPRYGYFFDTDDFAQVFEEFPAFKLTLDIGHANIECKDGRRVLKFIRKFGSRLGHVHLSDNDGKHDDHLPIGKGTVNFPKVVHALRAAGYDDTVTMEIFTDNRRHLRLSRDRFAAMLASK